MRTKAPYNTQNNEGFFTDYKADINTLLIRYKCFQVNEQRLGHSVFSTMAHKERYLEIYSGCLYFRTRSSRTILIGVAGHV